MAAGTQRTDPRHGDDVVALLRQLVLEQQRTNANLERLLEVRAPSRRVKATDAELFGELLPAIAEATKGAEFSASELEAYLPLQPTLAAVVEKHFGTMGTEKGSAEKRLGHALKRAAGPTGAAHVAGVHVQQHTSANRNWYSATSDIETVSKPKPR